MDEGIVSWAKELARRADVGENGVESGDDGLVEGIVDAGDTREPGSKKLSCGMVNTCSCGWSAARKLGWSGILYKLHK